MCLVCECVLWMGGEAGVVHAAYPGMSLQPAGYGHRVHAGGESQGGYSCPLRRGGLGWGRPFSQASSPRSARSTRVTVRAKLQVRITGASGPGFPTGRRPGGVGQGRKRKTVVRSQNYSMMRVTW